MCACVCVPTVMHMCVMLEHMRCLLMLSISGFIACNIGALQPLMQELLLLTRPTGWRKDRGREGRGGEKGGGLLGVQKGSRITAEFAAESDLLNKEPERKTTLCVMINENLTFNPSCPLA